MTSYLGRHQTLKKFFPVHRCALQTCEPEAGTDGAEGLGTDKGLSGGLNVDINSDNDFLMRGH